jgi:uncharacterized protein Yka (UPF0111/DUF47 family)
MRKTLILDELGEQSLLLPAQVNRGLGANDRVKYYFTLLQTARGHADDPAAPCTDLRAEREAAGVDDPGFDEVVGGSRRKGRDLYLIPGAARLLPLIVEALREMLAPVAAAAPEGKRHAARLATLIDALPACAGDTLAGAQIDAITRAQRKLGDSLHLLVMDLHKALNALQTRLAVENLDGALVYGLAPADRPLVQAFMAGLNATAPLKFDHPGLDTTATRVGERLVIQNDIGTTDTHVLVAHVEGMVTTLTYTDVHPRRARFFRSLFDPWGVNWDAAAARTMAGLEVDGNYQLCVGRHVAGDEGERRRYLEFLASRIVFLIDWNRARKRLHQFLKMSDCIAVITWAANHNHGHRAFLQLGGETLVYEAIDYAARAPVRYGERLDDILGGETVTGFLKFVLRTCAQGLLAGRSERLIRDEIKAELLNHFHRANQGTLNIAADHAALIVDLAEAVRDALLRATTSGEAAAQLAAQCKVWETRADALVGRSRDLARRAAGAPSIYCRIIELADDIADHLEEAAYLVALAPNLLGAYADDLRRLADLLVRGAQAYVRCLAVLATLHRGSPRDDVQDFLVAVDDLVDVEHRTDDVERELSTALIRNAGDFRQLALCSRLAERLETAADVLGRCGLTLRDFVLTEEMNS